MSEREIENTIPVLPARDLEAAIAFYANELGFELEWNEGTVCSVARDGCSVMLRRDPEPSPAMVWIGLVNDALIARLKESESVIQPPTNRPWAYEMKLTDPDGNVIWLGTGPKS